MNDQITEQLKSCPNLPSLPTIAMKVVEMSQVEDVDINEMADLISKDPALTGKILKTVNSSFYGLSKTISTISHAMVILGLQSVKTLVLGFSLVRNMRKNEDAEFDFQGYWQRSIYSAVAAKVIGMEVKLVQHEEAFLASLLQDMGMPVLHTAMGQQYDQLLLESGMDHAALPPAELEKLGTTHAEVGAFLAREWKLPPVLSEPIGHHHDPDNVRDDLKSLTQVVCMSGLCSELFMDHVSTEIIDRARAFAHAQFGFDESTFEDLLGRIGDNTREVAKLFEVPMGENRSYDAIMAKANQVLMDFSLRSQMQASQLETKARELEVQANTDALTQVANRKKFAQAMIDEFSRAKKFLRPMSMLVVDADRFKLINDTYGHDTGDAVLVQLAKTLSEAARQTDLVARYGGEEFVVLMPETEGRAALSMAESIRQAIEGEQICYEGKDIKVTVSVGIATFTGFGNSYPDAKSFFRGADAAVYAAKYNGRNRVEIAKRSEQASRS